MLFPSPLRVAIHSSGDILVAGGLSCYVKTFSAKGKFRENKELRERPTGIMFDNSRIYVILNNYIEILSYLPIIGTQGVHRES